MKFRIICILYLILFSTYSLSLVESENKKKSVSTELNLIFQSASNMNKDEIFVRFNRSILEEDSTFIINEPIEFSIEIDVADVTLINDTEPTQLDNWFFDEPDPLGEFSETRILGAFNFYLDDTDLGVYQTINYHNGPIISDQEIDVEIEEGWHWITIFAAEYCSDETRNTFYWKYAKDQTRFYVAEEIPETLPAIETANNLCNVKAIPVNHKDLKVYQADPFSWTYEKIQPRIEILDEQPTDFERTILRSRDDAFIEVVFNSTDTDLVLVDDSGRAMYTDVTHMGHSTCYWWVNDGEPINELEGTFNINNGYNFIIIVVAGFSTYYDFQKSVYIPMVKFGTKTFVVINEFLLTPINFISVILSIVVLASLCYLVKRRRKYKISLFSL
ncbi:MAG: hypothetical protein HGN29_05890 [Asgard group archaeon]|nr:hypothetical protein [Asgard group archaeon]